MKIYYAFERKAIVFSLFLVERVRKTDMEKGQKQLWNVAAAGLSRHYLLLLYAGDLNKDVIHIFTALETPCD